MDTAFCIDAVEEALARYRRPGIFNSEHRAPLVQANDIKIIMNEKELGAKVFRWNGFGKSVK